jgi:hypothetical protein
MEEAERELALLLRATKRRKLDLAAEETMGRLSMLVPPSAAELTSWEREGLLDSALQADPVRVITQMQAQDEQASSAGPDVSSRVVLCIEHSGASHSAQGWQPGLVTSTAIVKAHPDPL